MDHSCSLKNYGLKAATKWKTLSTKAGRSNSQAIMTNFLSRREAALFSIPCEKFKLKINAISLIGIYVKNLS